MSAEQFEPSVWRRHEDNSDRSPTYCPHCGDEIAHPENLRNNERIDAVSRESAYRRHREAHFGWGTDPADQFEDGDPFLADYYDGVETDGTGPTLDRNEEVAGIYEVEINYEAVMRARVVAADKGQAKERAQLLRDEAEDLTGHIPTREVTHELHDRTREIKRLSRGEIEDSSEVDEDEDSGINFAERLPGWPW
jgi:hypothetical protein